MRAFTNSPTLSGASLLLSPAKKLGRPSGRLSALLALGALLCALTASPAIARADHVQVVRLTAASTPVAWQSRQRVRRVTTISIRVNGHMLTNWDAHGSVAYDMGQGALVKVDARGKGAQPIRITAVSLNGTRHILIRYTWR